MGWDRQKSRVKVKEGDRVKLPWPKSAVPVSASDYGSKEGTVRTDARGLLVVDLDSGGRVDLPSRDFDRWDGAK